MPYPMRRVKTVFIDDESVQPSQLEQLNRDGFVAYIFVGKSQTKRSFETVSAIQDPGERQSISRFLAQGPMPLTFILRFTSGTLLYMIQKLSLISYLGIRVLIR